ncbi:MULTISPECIES: PqqD family protein [Candidatus Kuenenia]|uniref:Coenzyme PQQ synthesis protein D n=1 Tax=Kuenenia stuttgartiensis TaxID=174633 RepID=A0A2C9CCQ7_KUEST|nr:PqqD family protein [Candidatus Kuenenia stuttgartiensis]SOH03363.1 Coenzyme PQQ synthesis protein D [Candidatus Kuenenia stuttgartiensis]
MNFSKPKKKQKGVIIQDIGKEVVLRNVDEKTIHVLNTTARIIWELCDGEHTIGDMERQLRETFSIPDDTNICNDIVNTLTVLAEKGMLEEL